MTEGSLVSIGMPVYNGEAYIRQALDSLLAQDYEDFELLISDNASTDATGQICREYASKDPRVRYHRNATNIGITGNFDKVFELAGGELFMWAAHDDLWEPNFVSRCVRALGNNQRVVLSYPRARFVGLEGETIPASLPSFDTRGLPLVPRFNTVIWGIAYAHQIYGVIRSSALRRVLPLKNTLGADHALLAELALLGEFAYVPAPLFYIRRPIDKWGDRDEWLDAVDALTAKIDKHVTTRRSALYLYWQMIHNHLRAVNKHVRGPDKLALLASTLLCVLLKYHWLLKALLGVSEYKRGKG
jgi:glycosyltransferase involved in cell wall biosynthesis